jgi:hypothetical protein
MALWRRDQIRFDLEDDVTHHPVAGVTIETPAGRLSVIAEVARLAGTLMLLGLHVQSESVDVNAIGPGNLRLIVHAFVELMDLYELVATGGFRTTGAHPGRTPRERRFIRRRPA